MATRASDKDVATGRYLASQPGRILKLTAGDDRSGIELQAFGDSLGIVAYVGPTWVVVELTLDEADSLARVLQAWAGRRRALALEEE